MHSHYDIPGPLGALMEFTLVGIIIGYAVIAFQFNRARYRIRQGASLKVDGDAAVAFEQLIAIFLLCASCGYLPRLIPLPVILMVVLHVTLLGVTWRYVMARQAILIASALARA